MRATPSVAGRPGLRAGALGPDTQGTARVQPDDGSSAGPDGVHCERREPDRETSDRSLVLASRLPVDDRADIGRRSAHVEREHVVEAGELREVSGADRARGGAGEEGVGGMRGGLVECREAA